MSISDHGKVTQSLQVSNLEVTGHGFSSSSGSVHATGNISGRVIPYTTVSTSSTATAYTITPVEVLGGIIVYSAAGGTWLTLPTAALLVAAIPRCKVGMTLPLLIVNTNDTPSDTVSLVAGDGGSLVQAAETIYTDTSALYWIRISNVTPGAAAYVGYRVGEVFNL